MSHRLYTALILDADSAFRIAEASLEPTLVTVRWLVRLSVSHTFRFRFCQCLWGLTKRRDNIVVDNMEVDMVADMEVDKVADMEVDMVANMEVTITKEVTTITKKVGTITKKVATISKNFFFFFKAEAFPGLRIFSALRVYLQCFQLLVFQPSYL